MNSFVEKEEYPTPIKIDRIEKVAGVRIVYSNGPEKRLFQGGNE